jgi:DNA-binding CsgD family transcriptional regulator
MIRYVQNVSTQMENLLSGESLLSSVQQCFFQVIVETGAATGELQANNQELEAIIEGLLSVRGDLRAVFSDNSFSSFEKPITQTAGNQDADMDGRFDFHGQTEWIVGKSQAVIKQSESLRTKSKKVREALLHPIDGHITAPVNGHIKAPRSASGHLSKRERQVLALIVAGKSSKQLAVELGISFKTAVTHRASIMSKMEVHEIASVVREAIRRGWA